MSSKSWLMVGAAAVILLVGVAIGALLIDRDTSKDQQTASNTPSSQSSSESQSEQSSKISREEAGRIATDEYGGEVIDIESDSHNGEPTWEVEIRNSRQGRIEVDVSQATGDIVDMERD